MRTPRNGRKITKIDQAAFPQPPMSCLRKMSAKILNSRSSQANHRKKISIDQNTSMNG